MTIPAFMVRDTLRGSAAGWEESAVTAMKGAASDPSVAPMLMAAAYASLAADLLQWIEQRHPNEALDIAAAVDDVLTNGGSLSA